MDRDEILNRVEDLRKYVHAKQWNAARKVASWVASHCWGNSSLSRPKCRERLVSVMVPEGWKHGDPIP